MNLDDARLILDNVKVGAGENIPERLISQALCATGDLTPLRKKAGLRRVHFMCPRCQFKKAQRGSGLRQIFGLRRKVCSACAGFIDRSKQRSRP